MEVVAMGIEGTVLMRLIAQLRWLLNMKIVMMVWMMMDKIDQIDWLGWDGLIGERMV